MTSRSVTGDEAPCYAADQRSNTVDPVEDSDHRPPKRTAELARTSIPTGRRSSACSDRPDGRPVTGSPDTQRQGSGLPTGRLEAPTIARQRSKPSHFAIILTPSWQARTLAPQKAPQGVEVIDV